MGARPYAPQIGRFLAVDPVEGGATTNAYGYVNDPVNTKDLTGTAITPAEKKWCVRFPVKCNRARKLRNFLNKNYEGAGDDTLDNARKHVILIALWTFENGVGEGREFGNRHEIKRCDGTGSASERMDCHNNRVGVAIGQLMRNSVGIRRNQDVLIGSDVSRARLAATIDFGLRNFLSTSNQTTEPGMFTLWHIK